MRIFIEVIFINFSIAYLRNNYEIDFRCKDTLYQVSSDLNTEKIRERELKSFDYLDKEKALNHKLITYDEDGEEMA